MAVRIQIRRDNGTNWTNNNTILAQGELGYDLDNGNFKIGTGSVAWADLPYFATKDKVGLTNVQNFNIATQNEAETGTSNELYMTPLRTAEAIAAQTGTILTSGSYATESYVDTSVSSLAGDGLLWSEVLEIYNLDYATNQEATTGTSTTKVLTPANAKYINLDGGEF
jgi:hypothetical protein